MSSISLEQAVAYYFIHRNDEEYGPDHRKFCRIYVACLRHEQNNALKVKMGLA